MARCSGNRISDSEEKSTRSTPAHRAELTALGNGHEQLKGVLVRSVSQAGIVSRINVNAAEPDAKINELINVE